MDNHGVVFKRMTKMQTMRDVYLLHLHVRLPDLVKEIQTVTFHLGKQSREALCRGHCSPVEGAIYNLCKDGNDNDSWLAVATVKSCEHLERVTRLLSEQIHHLRKETVSKVKEMGMYIPALETEIHSRVKRSLLMILGGLFGVGNAILTHSRISKLQTSVSILRRNQDTWISKCNW